jgi:hypothetical protein
MGYSILSKYSVLNRLDQTNIKNGTYPFAMLPRGRSHIRRTVRALYRYKKIMQEVPEEGWQKERPGSTTGVLQGLKRSFSTKLPSLTELVLDDETDNFIYHCLFFHLPETEHIVVHLTLNTVEVARMLQSFLELSASHS